MKLGKKIVSTTLASALIVSTGATAFAAMPNDTILLKDEQRAMELKNIDLDTLIGKVTDADTDNLYYKVMDSWINVDTGMFIDASNVPAVSYENEDGTKTDYEAGDGDAVTTPETAEIESVEAVTTTKIKVKFNRAIDAVTAANFAIEGVTIKAASLTEDKMTVELTTAAISPNTDYTLTTTGIKVDGNAQDPMTKAFKSPTVQELYSGTTLTFDDEDGILKADGASQTTFKFELKDAEGNLITDAEDVEVRFTATFGQFAEDKVTVQNGVATVLFTSETLTSAKESLIEGTIVEAADKNLINIQAENKITLDPDPGSGPDVTLGARVTAVEGFQADRVILYFDKEVTPEKYMTNGLYDPDKALVTVKKGNGTAVTPKGYIALADNKKALELLLDVEATSTNALTDNDNVTVDFTDKTGSVELPTLGKTYVLTDARRPSMLNVANEGLKTIKVTFSEAISDTNNVGLTPSLSAEALENWTIDGIFLNEKAWGDTAGLGAAATVLVGEYSATTGEDNRNVVTITLGKDKDGKQLYFTAGDHSIQGANTSDWAGLTDTLNNRMNTQTLDFNIDADTSKPVATVEVQSPEQWLVKFDKDVDGDITSKITLEEYTTAWAKKSDKTLGAPELDDNLDIVVTKINDREFLVETDLDWTDVHNTDTSKKNYYNYNYRLNLQASAVTNPANGLANDATMLDLNGPIMESLDATSPKTVAIEETANVAKGTSYDVTVSEPIKLRLTATTGANNEGATDSEGQGSNGTAEAADWGNISQATARFYNDAQKITIEGTVTGIVDDYDTKVRVVPNDTLTAGEWTLTIEQLSDDIGNGFATEAKNFTVEGGSTVTSDFEIAWAYADKDADRSDDMEYDQDNVDGADQKDAVYVKFTKPVMVTGESVNALKTSNYTLNSDPLPLGTQIGANIIGWDNHDAIIDSVTIMLPHDTITDVETTVINVSANLTSKDGEKLKNPGEHKLSYRYTSATVTDMDELKAAIADTKVRSLSIAAMDINEAITIDRLMDINLTGKVTVSGSLKVDTQETGRMILSGANTLAQLEVNAQNADFEVAAGTTVTALTVKDLYSNSLENKGTITTLTVEDDTTVSNTGTVTTLNVKGNVELENEGTITTTTVDAGKDLSIDGNLPTTLNAGTAAEKNEILVDQAHSAEKSVDPNTLAISFTDEISTDVTISYSIDGAAFKDTGVTQAGTTNPPSIAIADAVNSNITLKYTAGAGSDEKSVTEMVYSK